MLHERIIGKYVRIRSIFRNIWHKQHKLPSLFFHVSQVCYLVPEDIVSQQQKL